LGAWVFLDRRSDVHFRRTEKMNAEDFY